MGQQRMLSINSATECPIEGLQRLCRWVEKENNYGEPNDFSTRAKCIEYLIDRWVVGLPFRSMYG